jgi:tripeptidyl-peptidase-1
MFNVFGRLFDFLFDIQFELVTFIMQHKSFVLIIGVLLCVEVALCGTTFAAGAKRSKQPTWIKESVADLSNKTNIIIALKQRNLDLLEKTFWSVSDPFSKEYQNYLSLEKIAELIGPNDETIRLVINWISTHIDQETSVRLTMSKDFIEIKNISAKKINQILNTQLHYFTHADHKNVRVIRAEQYTIPSPIDRHIDFIGGLIDFPLKKSQFKSFADQGITITPSTIWNRYSYGGMYGGKSSSNAQAVTEFGGGSFGQYYSPSDLTFFQQKFNVMVNNVSKLYGKNDPTQPAGEATLDIQYIMSSAQNVSTWFWEEFGTEIEWLTHISDTPDAPWVHSVSYSFGNEVDTPLSYWDRLNAEFMKAGVRGLSLLFGSGDDGTGSTGWVFCDSFNPGFPATSPYTTAVGATYLEADMKTENSASFSGGGFSTFLPRPSYQQKAVNRYLTSFKSQLPSSSYYNSTNRAFPDVAVLGTNYQIVVTGGVFGASGTSASTPTFAGIISLINDVLLSKPNGKPLGFLNPLLYKLAELHPDAFFDITKGSNPASPCSAGFPATPGWDAISGLGAPIVPKFLQYVQEMINK